MRTIAVVFFLSLACSLTATPFARRLALRLGFLDQPGARKLHRDPIPLLGGIAIYAAVLLAVVVFGRHYFSQVVGLLAAATVISACGLWDDRAHLPWPAKLGVQIAVAAGLYMTGVRTHLGWIPGWGNVALTVFWLIGITNAVNLLDNMDGLSCGVSAVAAAFLTIISAMNGQFMVSSLSAAVLGACAGFLFFNTRPASIFMGDAGSLFLGFLLAAIGIKLRFPANSDFVTWMVPVVTLGVPVFDTTLVFVSRLRRGVNPFSTAGKDHTSHRLVARGLSQLEAVLVLYLAGCCCGLLAVFLMHATIAEGYQAGAVLLLVAAVMIWRLEKNWT